MLPAFATLCWILSIRHLSSEWTLNKQYHFGWLVPFLALYLVRMRAEKLPLAGAASRRAVVAGVLLVALAEMLLLPVREANADWRLLGWLLTVLATLAAWLALAQAGGVPWMAHFSFPILFFFTAVPWPRPVEIDVMQWLMRHNAKLATEALGWLGVNAEVQGNLIRLTQNVLGVDEACSGIRSLQGTLMATLFVGELFELQRGRRVFLLLVGAVWALVTNTGRTVFLALTEERSGSEALESWHDPAGYWTLGICFLAVMGTGWFLRRGQRSRAKSNAGEVARQSHTDWRLRLKEAAGPALAGIALLLAGWVATECWFRLRESSVTRVAEWSFRQPREAAYFETAEQSKHVRGELRYDYHSGGHWQDAEGRRWVAHFFRWDAGRNAIRTVIVHDPRVCIGASGKDFVQSLPAVNFAAGGIVLPFDGYWFRDRGEDVYVFNCVVEDVRRGPDREPERAEITMRSRLEAVRMGKRNLGQRRLEVAVWGAHDAAAARVAFEELLQRQIEVREIPVGTRGS
ncbi:MAG TPA: exosortase/archaeosortase family protein [Verrucomicrobiaceae bacterium]|jgi:exosortase